MRDARRILSGLPQPQCYRFSVHPDDPTRPNNKEIAEALAKMIVENGLIHADGPRYAPDEDLKEWRFTLYAYKKQEKLP